MSMIPMCTYLYIYIPEFLLFIRWDLAGGWIWVGFERGLDGYLACDY
jgi:hypothetical protein